MCFEILWDIVLYIDVLVSIFTYPVTCVVDVIHQMCFHIISCTYAFAYMTMYVFIHFMIMDNVIEKLINKTFLNVTQHEGTLKELKLYL